MKSPNRLPVGTNPRGKPKGGNGATRKTPKKIDEEINVKFSKEELAGLKEKYGNKLKIKKVKLYVWDIPPIKMLVTLFIAERIYSTSVRNRLRSWIISLKNGFAGSYEKIVEHIEDLTGETFSQQTIKDCVHRTGENLMPCGATSRLFCLH